MAEGWLPAFSNACWQLKPRMANGQMLMATYRGRLAPSPTGYLHLGHARTFWVGGSAPAQHMANSSSAMRPRLSAASRSLSVRCRRSALAGAGLGRRARQDDRLADGGVSSGSVSHEGRWPRRLWAVFPERTSQLLSRRMAQVARQRSHLPVHVLAKRFGECILGTP